MMEYNFIAVEGNIGAGKTTLARMLSHRFGANLLLEGFEDNAFLPKFYREPERYAFPLELSFLAERFQQLNSQSLGPNLFSTRTVSDYFIGKSLIFAKTNLAHDEYKLFSQLFEIMFQTIPKPDVLIYLYAPTDKLLENIRKRGRRYEQDIKVDYLESIQQQYLEFLRKHGDAMRVLLIDTSNLDFVKNPQDFDKILVTLQSATGKGVYYQDIG